MTSIGPSEKPNPATLQRLTACFKVTISKLNELQLKILPHLPPYSQTCQLLIITFSSISINFSLVKRSTLKTKQKWPLLISLIPEHPIFMLMEHINLYRVGKCVWIRMVHILINKSND